MRVFCGGVKRLGRTLTEIVKTADEVGFGSIWVMDRFFQIRAAGSAWRPPIRC
jgi:alkanesulfonate monooxygenase SsuD/methylene tetrahydromethanopterin reductase-like flavin-dependent oxidoreductase (luciferase family)